MSQSVSILPENKRSFLTTAAIAEAECPTKYAAGALQEWMNWFLVYFTKIWIVYEPQA
jgi:hypothetical protein